MRTFKIDKYIPQWIAIAATLMCLSAGGDVLVSNFFDDNSADQGDITSSGHFYEVNCINGVAGDNNPCDSENDRLAISFIVGGEFDYAFEGVQLELRQIAAFNKVNVYLDEGDDPESEEVSALAYTGDAASKATNRFRGTFTADNLVLERGGKYWIRIERKSTESGRNSSVWFTNSKKQESIDSGWDIGNTAKFRNTGDSWVNFGPSKNVMRLTVLGARALTADRLTLWYYECPMGRTMHWIRLRTSYPIYISNSELIKAFADIDGGSVDRIKRIRWTHEYIDGIKRKVTREYRLRVIPDMKAGDVMIKLNASEGCGGSSLCADAELGLIGDHKLVIPSANQPPTLSISENTEHPNYDSMDEGFFEIGDMSFSTTLSGPPISHYRFEVKTVEGKNKGTATPCTGSTKVCKDKEDPDDYYPGEHGQFIIAVLNDENELVFEDPAPTLVYLVNDAVEEDDESVVVKLHEAYTVGDRSKRYCPISITTSHATGMIVDDD